MFNYIAIICTIQITVGYHCGEEWIIWLGWKRSNTFSKCFGWWSM